LILEFEFASLIIIFAKSMILISFGDGNQTRAFLYVSDWVEATKRMLFTQGLKGEVFDVGIRHGEEPREIPWFSTAAALTRRDVLEKVGGF